MTSSRYPLDEIRARCDIVEIISQYVALKRSGKNLKGLCPFHAEKTPSFVVNSETQRWMCFGCHENGDVFSFLMRIEGLTFPEAVEQLAGRAGVDLSSFEGDSRSTGERDLVLRINSLAAEYFREVLAKNQEAREYLKRRGITPEASERFKLGFATSEWRGLADYLRSKKVKPEDAAKAGLVIIHEKGGFYDRFRHRLIFPIFDVQDHVVAFGGRALADGDVKYINSPETRVFVKNKTLYALNFARKSIVDQGCVVLVEGYMDALTAHAAGITNVVATMGTALTSEHVKILSRYTQRAVLAFDADSAGMSAALRSAPMFEEAEFDVRAIPMPQGEDPDSLIRNGGRAVFAELIMTGVPIPDYKLKLIAEKHDLNTRAGQVAMLKEAILVVAEVDQQVERERLIALLAPYHPNFRGGTVPAEMHIRQEVESRRARAQRKQKYVPAASEKKNLLSEEVTAVCRAERELLGNIICHSSRWEDILTQVPPDVFVGEDTKILAYAVQQEVQITGTLNIDALATKVAGTPGEQLLNELLVNQGESSNVPVADLIGTIKTYRKREQEKRFRTLAEKFQRGEIKRTDKEFAEYWQLVRDLHT